MEDLSAPLAAQKASVNKLQNDDGLESKIPIASELSEHTKMLKGILRATEEHTTSVDELSFQMMQNEDVRTQEMGKLDESKASLKAIERQNAAARVDELAVVFVKQNAAILAAMQEQSRATERQTRAIERQTLAIEKLAAPGRPARESGKRKRVEGASADAANQQGRAPRIPSPVRLRSS